MAKVKMFESNEECAEALYRYLIEHGHITAKEPFVQGNNILHDINNLRGHEWLELLPRNAETEAFFAYLDPEYVQKMIDANDKEGNVFIFIESIPLGEYWELATGESGVTVTSLDALRVMLDKAGPGEVWDYPMEDIDEAMANNEHLVVVEDLNGDTAEWRVFEVTDEMYERYEKMYGPTTDIRSVDEAKAEVMAMFDAMQAMNPGPACWIASDMAYMLYEAKGNEVENFGVEEAYVLASKLNEAMTGWFTVPVSRGEYVSAVCDLLANGITQYNNSDFEALNAADTLKLLLNADDTAFGVLVESTAVQNCYRYLPDDFCLDEADIVSVEKAIEAVRGGVDVLIADASSRVDVVEEQEAPSVGLDL